MGSLSKKIQSILKNGTDPIKIGMNNYKANISEIEELARKRMKLSVKANKIEKEPISFLRIKDERIKELDGMMHSDCGCACPYLFRQSLKIMPEWDEY